MTITAKPKYWDGTQYAELASNAFLHVKYLNEGFRQDWNDNPYSVNQTTVNSANGILDITSTGTDPYISMIGICNLDPLVYRYVRLRYKVVSGSAGNCDIYFLNTAYTSANASAVKTFTLNNDFQWHDVLIDMWTATNWSNGGNITGFRLDWCNANGTRMQIDLFAVTTDLAQIGNIMGMYTDSTQADSTDPNMYAWTSVVSDTVTTGRFVSTIPVGTSPLAVTSTTKVVNLNADRLDDQEGSYYLDWTNFTNKPDPVITLAGDATGSVTLTDLGSGTLTVTVADNSHSHTSANISDATNANTASMIVKRDASGNFSAGTITATLSGNATSATSATTATNLANGSAGTIPYQSASGTTAMLSAGTSKQVLTSNGTSAPSWQTLDMTYVPDSTFKKSVRVASTADVGASTQTTTTLTGYGTSPTLACTTTAGSTTVTTTSTASLKVGAVVKTATVQIAGGTTVATIASATTFTVTNRATITTTAITGNGTTATATFAAQTYAPYAVGSSIVISGAVPSTYNGTFTVTACTTTTVSWSSVETVTATTQGSINFTIAVGSSISTAFAQSISALVVDGVTVALNDRVLLKNQSTVGGVSVTANRDNGIFYVSTLGTTSVPWVLTRPSDADTITKIASALVAVDEGATNGGFLFDNDLKTTDTLGTTAIGWNSSADNGKKLNFFSATTSAELAGVISDETGSGLLVFATSPTLSGTPLSTTASADTNTTQIATTAFVIGQASASTPKMDGTGTVGTSKKYSRDDHIHPSDTARVPMSTLSATTPATAGWYRIAQSAVNIGSNSAEFKIDFSGTGVIGRAKFTASCQNGVTTGTNVNQSGYTSSDYTKAITKARVVYHTTYTGNYAYVEVYNPTALALTLTVDLVNSTGWTSVTPSTAGSIPGGYSNIELTLDRGIVSLGDATISGQYISNLADGTAPLVVTSTTKVVNLNSDRVDNCQVNDSGTTTSDLWTANKIASYIASFGYQPSSGSVSYATNADTVDLHHMDQDVLTTSSPTFNSLSVTSLKVGASTTAGNILKADASGNATWNAPSSFTVKFDSGSTEGTDLYTYNPWSAETVNFVGSTNVTLTKAPGSVTLSSPSLSLGTTVGAGNAVTDIGVSGHQITMTKGSTFLTSATGVTSFSAGTTGLTPSSATVGAVTLAGTLKVSNGGTGATSTVQGGVVYGASPTAYGTTSVGTAGQILKSNGTGAPAWVTLDMTYMPDAVWKKSVKVATTANLTVTATTTTLTNSGTLSAIAIDGVTLSINDRVLVKNQTTSSQNGIYYVSNIGSASVAWVLTRVAGADSVTEVAGAVVNVDQGTSGGILFSNNFKTTDTLGSSSMPWYQVYSSADSATSNTANKLVLRDASGNFSAGTITASLSGNATTATKFETVRTINGTNFDGTANITITADPNNHNLVDTTKHPVSGLTAGQVLRATGATTYAFQSIVASDIPTLNQSTTGSSASCTGNSATATKLANPRTINGVNFDGTANITVTADPNNHNLVDTLKHPVSGLTSGQVLRATGATTYAFQSISASDIPTLNQSTTGNAGTATKLATSRTISLTGGVTGSAGFDGSANASITATVVNDSHTHDTQYYTKAQLNTIRNETFDNFTYTGLTVTPTATALQISVAIGTAYVGGIRYTPTTVTLTLTASTTQYIYVDNTGVVKNSATAPTGDYADLATVIVPASGVIPAGNITDTRDVITNTNGRYTFDIYNDSGTYAQIISSRGAGSGLQIKNAGSSNALVVTDLDTSKDMFLIDGSGNTNLYNGADFYVYSDAGVTQKFSIDGATGNTNIVGTLSVTGAITGNVATSSKLQTARTISLSSDVTGSASFDGSQNITITATVVDDSHNHIISNVDNLQSILDAKTPLTTITATLPATSGWYRIATSAVDIGRNSGLFFLDWAVSGDHGRVAFTAGCHYGQDATLNQLNYESYSGQVTQARVVYNTTYATNYAYLEFYHSGTTLEVVKVDLIDGVGWTLVAPNTSGSIPAGYTSKSLTFVDGIATSKQFKSDIATGTAPLVVASTTQVTNLNASYLGGYAISTASQKDVWGTIPTIGGADGVMEVGKYLDFHIADGSTTDYDVRLTANSGNLTCSGSFTATSFSGNASSADKWSTQRSLTLTGDTTGTTTFDGSANISVVTTTRDVAFVGSDVASSNGWYKVATQTCSGFGNTNLTFMVTSTYSNYNSGILQLQVRSDSTSISCPKLEWLSLDGFNVANFVVVISGMTWTLYAYQPNAQYGRIMFEIISQSSIGTKDQTWTLTFADNITKESVAPTATVTSTDGSNSLTMGTTQPTSGWWYKVV